MNRVMRLVTSLILFFAIIFVANESPADAEKQPKPKNFSVYVNGRIVRFSSNQEKVGAALDENGVIYNKKQMFPKANALLVDGTQIFLLARGEKFEFEELAIADSPIEYVDDPTLEYGSLNVAEKGAPGLDKVIYKVDTSGKRRELGRISKIKPSRTLIQRGTKDCIMTEEGLKHYKKKFVANVSAYTIEDGNGDGVTSIGMVPYEGVVAVDPDFIPYKSKLFIPGYGMAVAGDTGGAIINNCIDLFMYDRDRAWEWGRRHIEVYLLDDK